MRKHKQKTQRAPLTLRNKVLLALAVATWIGLLFLTFFPFRFVLDRLAAAAGDLLTSIFYWFCSLFYDELWFDSTLPTIPDGMDSVLPMEWETFAFKMECFLDLLFDGENFVQWLVTVGSTLLPIVRWLVLFGIFGFCVCKILEALLFVEDDKKGQTKPLITWLKFEKKVLGPSYLFLRDYLLTITQKGWKRALTISFFLLAFNVGAVLVETLALLFYFSSSFNFLALYAWFVKIFYDLVPIFRFLPFPAWIAIVWLTFLYVRRRCGEKRLRSLEGHDVRFVRSLSFCSLFDGLMGMGKTTLCVDLALTTDVLFREDGLERIREKTTFFPYFPWSAFFQDVLTALSNHVVYDFNTARLWMEDKAQALEKDPLSLYGYDTKTYPIGCSNGIANVGLFSVLMNCTLYLLLYTEPSLIRSNIAVRQDNHVDDIGNLPLWNDDFLALYPKSKTHYSHILDFDMLRMVKKIRSDSASAENRPQFSYGIDLISELDKERGNQVENVGKKMVTVDVNQKNDGFNKTFKMGRHASSIDGECFWRCYMDCQRTSDVGAGLREIADNYHIAANKKRNLALPFFFVEELLYALINKLDRSVWAEYHYSRQNETLLFYLFRRLTGGFIKFYKRTYNFYGYDVLTLYRQKDGKNEGDPLTYFLLYIKDRSDRFATDCYSEYFHNDSNPSKVGLRDLPFYTDPTPSMEEYDEQQSYFIRDITGMTEKAREDADMYDQQFGRR